MFEVLFCCVGLCECMRSLFTRVIVQIVRTRVQKEGILITFYLENVLRLLRRSSLNSKGMKRMGPPTITMEYDSIRNVIFR